MAFLFYYRIWLETGQETEKVVAAYTEGEAFQKIERAFPNWESVELLHQKTIGRDEIG